MSTEEQIQQMMLRLAPPPSAQAEDWQGFVGAARRDRRKRGLYGLASTTVVVVLIAVVIVAVARWDRFAPAPVGTTQGIGFDDYPTGWTSLTPPPEVRLGSADAMSDTQAFTWGGYSPQTKGDVGVTGDGYAFDAATGEWDALPDGPLSERSFAAAQWTGTEFVLWGGSTTAAPFGGDYLSDGAAFDPARGTWRMLPAADITARAPLSVWTGTEMIVWGTSERQHPPPRDGAIYDPSSNSWRRIPPAPIELTDAVAVWTGKEMIVFGASLDNRNFGRTEYAVGAAYDPLTDSWRRLPDSHLLPQATTAAWDGKELIAWDYGLEAQAYDPAADTWRDLPSVPLDASECYPGSVAVGSYIVGDYCGAMVEHQTGRGWNLLARRGLTRYPLPVATSTGQVAFLSGTSEERYRPWAAAYRPTNLGRVPVDPVTELRPGVVRSGDRAALLVRRAPGIWGLRWPLQRYQDGAWTEFGTLLAGPGSHWHAAFHRPGEDVDVPEIGFVGPALMYLDVPELEPGRYRLVRDFIKNGDGSIEDRTDTYYANFEVIR